jgi:hypothetical protein
MVSHSHFAEIHLFLPPLHESGQQSLSKLQDARSTVQLAGGASEGREIGVELHRDTAMEQQWLELNQ